MVLSPKRILVEQSQLRGGGILNPVRLHVCHIVVRSIFRLWKYLQCANRAYRQSSKGVLGSPLREHQMMQANLGRLLRKTSKEQNRPGYVFCRYHLCEKLHHPPCRHFFLTICRSQEKWIGQNISRHFQSCRRYFYQAEFELV